MCPEQGREEGPGDPLHDERTGVLHRREEARRHRDNVMTARGVMIRAGPEAGVTRMKTHRSRRALFTLAVGLGLMLRAYPVWATSLHLEFVDTDGTPVQVAKAELLLSAWGMEAERVELETSPDGLSLELEPEWLRSRWPPGWPSPPGGRPLAFRVGAHLYLQAPPLAAIQSDRFQWPGGVPGDSVDPDRRTTITFPRGQEAVVPQGQHVRMTLVFRPRAPRRVRFVDPRGRPWSDFRFHTSMFWSDDNHCAVVTGSESLGSHVTDAAGWSELPDGEFVYALGIRWPHMYAGRSLEDSRTPQRLIARLTDPGSAVVVRELKVRPLEVRVRLGGKPAAGLHLRARGAFCGCGACDGPVGTTDGNGRIRREDFRPDSHDEIWLMDGDTEVWRSPSTWGVVEIDL